ncbi:hypothetical protein GF376_00205 [Candidatus Peregrinibacteria bacterium]|nr:hypothetical protein [Candidatus Peregrinibacteria bacterium]
MEDKKTNTQNAPTDQQQTEVKSINLDKADLNKQTAKPSNAWSEAVPEIKKEEAKKAASSSSGPIKLDDSADSSKNSEAANQNAGAINLDKPAEPSKGSNTTSPKPAPINLDEQSKDSEQKAKSDFFSSVALQDKTGTESKIMDNITNRTTLDKPKTDKILGSNSLLEKGVEAETKQKQKKKLQFAKFIFYILLVVAVLGNGFLFYQLSPGITLGNFFEYKFEGNLTNQLALANDNLKSVNTNINKYNYLTGQLYLDQFALESSRYFDNVKFLESPESVNQRGIIQAEISEIRNRLPGLLENAKDYLTETITIDTFASRLEEENALSPEIQAQTSLRQAIFDDKEEYVEQSEGEYDPRDPEVLFYNNAAKLVGNSKLITNLRSISVDEFTANIQRYAEENDPVFKEEVRSEINELLLSSQADLAIINDIKDERIVWSNVIDGIERVTNSVDAQFRTDRSNTTYSSFDLDSDNNRISVSGINTTTSGNNRNVMASLIEDFESDDQFKNASNRSFPLSKNIDENGFTTYSMNFKLDLEVEDDTFSINNNALTETSGNLPERTVLSNQNNLTVDDEVETVLDEETEETNAIEIEEEELSEPELNESALEDETSTEEPINEESTETEEDAPAPVRIPVNR